MGAFLGLRGTGDWVANTVPENYREVLLRLYPNGDCPLTAMTAKMKTNKIDSFVRHWFSKTLPTQRATITGRYINSTLTTAYVYATHSATVGAVGGTIYLKMALEDVKHFHIGHQVLLRDADRYDVDIVGRVSAVVMSGANSYIAVKLVEADDNSTTAATYNLSTVDTALIVGSSFSEGSERPTAVSYDEVEFYNYSQIFKNAIDLTRTALETKKRTGDPRQEARREALELHGIELEKAMLWGIRSSSTGENGKPLRTMMGLIPMIKTYASANCADYTLETDAAYKTKTWVAAGQDWFEAKLEQMFRYGRDQKLAYCGSGALLGIQTLVRAGSQYQLTPMATSYGIKVVEWVTPFGILYLKRHPLFSYEATNRNSMVIFEPENLSYCPLHDTDFKEDKSWTEGGGTGKDGPDEEYLTEATIEYNHPETFGYLNGVGQLNTQS